MSDFSIEHITEEDWDEGNRLINSIQTKLGGGDASASVAVTEVFSDTQWKDFLKKLKRKIQRKLKEEGVPDFKNQAVEARNKFQNKLSEIMGSKKGSLGAAEKELLKHINAIFRYEGKRFKLEDLKRPLKGQITTPEKYITNQRITDLNNAIDNAKVFIDSEQHASNLINRLQQHLQKQSSERGEKYSHKYGTLNLKTDFKILEEFQQIDIGSIKGRERTYSYWEGIHSLHDDLVDAVKGFKIAVENWKPSKKQKDKEFNKVVKEFKKFWSDGDDIKLPNYVLKLPAFNMGIPNSFVISQMVVKQYAELAGMTEKQETVELWESAKKLGLSEREAEGGEFGLEEEAGFDHKVGMVGRRTAAGEREAEIGQEGGKVTATDIDMTNDFDKIEVPKLPYKKEMWISVDPLFWWKFNDDFDKIKISEENIEKVRKHIHGVAKGDIGLKHWMFKDNLKEYLPQFEQWFEKLETEVTKTKGPYYLPISNFIENDYYASDDWKRPVGDWKEDKSLEVLDVKGYIERGEEGFPKWAEDIGLDIVPEFSMEEIEDGKYEYTKRKIGTSKPKVKDFKNKLISESNATDGPTVSISRIAEIKPETTKDKVGEEEEKRIAEIGNALGEIKPLTSDGKIISKDKIKIIHDSTSEFLTLVAKTMEKIKTMFDVYIPRVTQKGEDYSTLQPIMLLGSKGEKRLIPEDIEESWEKMIKAIQEYYLEPMKSREFVDKIETPRWANDHASIIIGLEGDLPTGSLQAKQTLEVLKVGEVEALDSFFSNLKYEESQEDVIEAYKKGREIVGILNDLYDKKYRDLNKLSVYHIINQKQKGKFIPDSRRTLLRFWGSQEELNKELEKVDLTKSPLYSFDKIFDTQHAKNLGFTESRKGKLDKDGKPTGDIKLDYYSKDEQKVIEALWDLHDTLEQLNIKWTSQHKYTDEDTKIGKSLLSAHDAIRKMKGKPIYESYLDTDDIKDMDIIITKIEKEHKMSITAIEVDSIVKSVSSYESLAKNFGVNEDVIYTIKAMFR